MLKLQEQVIHFQYCREKISIVTVVKKKYLPCSQEPADVFVGSTTNF